MTAGLSVRPTPAACRISTASPILLHPSLITVFRVVPTLICFKDSFMYIHWYYCVLHSIPLMYFTESLYVILSSRIYFEFYVYLWDIPRCVACWFYVFLCTLSEMTNKTCTINQLKSFDTYLCLQNLIARCTKSINRCLKQIKYKFQLYSMEKCSTE